ncbi:MAG: QueT transporter family protein [Clostridia bacterium]|nr:QueT transporter family protein [Clostridia bacterium]
MTNSKAKLQYITTAAIIAAVYAALTYFGSFFGLSYGPIQLRFSEVLTILPIFTPAAIPGLTIGCFIANIGSFNLLDMVFGTLATLIAAILTRLFKDIKFKGIPLLSLFPPVIVNALIIGLEIAIFFLPEGLSLYGFLISALQVGTGQLIVCYVLGIPFYFTVKKTKLLKFFGCENK